MATIMNCPVCGKSPKLKHRNTDIIYHVVNITCKPLFGKLHEEAIAYGRSSDEAHRDAIYLWNARVKAYEERKKNANA